MLGMSMQTVGKASLAGRNLDKACTAYIWCLLAQHACCLGLWSPSNDAKRDIAGVIRSSPLAGLCYATQAVEAGLFPVATPDKTPYALSEDFYQEKLPSKSLVERFRRKNRLL
jgi:hypothetical protein